LAIDLKRATKFGDTSLRESYVTEEWGHATWYPPVGERVVARDTFVALREKDLTD
jgi:hypothetical protein